MRPSTPNSTHKNKAFTLIELLIVMTIVGTLLSLVGPLAIEALNKAQARAELLSIKTWLVFQGQKAFITGQSIELSFDGKAVYLVSEQTKKQTVREFDYLFFQPQFITFSNHGISSTLVLKATFSGEELTLPVADWISENVYQ